MPCRSSFWLLVALVFVPINGSNWRLQGLISTGAVVLGPTLLGPSIICATGQEVLCGRGSCLQNMAITAAERDGGCCVLYENVLADFTLLRVSDVTSVPRRVAEA
ncbi:hypothetical protein TcCL_ESM07186 [Trypanosoma cruzi]|nr:hypothetical protein TcCL_ESM07186 [Trypanosoma cruzi]